LIEASTVEEHRAALASINEGSFDFNHVYAHKDGHIGWEVYGRLPRRRTDGLFVRDADDPAAQWDGFIPFEEMPKIINPPRGYVGSANSIVDPRNFLPIATSPHFEPRFRVERIEAFLAQHAPHSTDTFAELQRDVGTDYGARVCAELIRLLDMTGVALDGPARAAIDVLKEWNGDFASHSQAAPIFFFLLQDFCRRAFRALLGDSIGKRYAGGRHSQPRLIAMLLDRADPLRADIEHAAAVPLGRLIFDALGTAVQRTTAVCGEAPEAWRWGAVQRARLGTILAATPVIGSRFVALESEYPGGDYSVSLARSLDFGKQLYAFVGASSRFICDLANPEEALFAHSSGPSGDVESAFFANTSALWDRREYFRSALWKADEVPNVVERVVV
jgi:penicillin amidase